MNDLQIFSPPEFPTNLTSKSIFLGGSIEMDKAENWQKLFIDRFRQSFTSTLSIMNRDIGYLPDIASWKILNPRREKWDSNLEQSINNPQFFQQVTWELDFLKKCKHKVFYFAKDTLSPITLLEFGKFSTKYPDDVYLYIDPAYLRKGNLEIYCHKYNIRPYESIDSIITTIKSKEFRKPKPV